MLCEKCTNAVEAGRLALNIRMCLECGKKDALKEISRKAKSVVPAFNKGGLTYLSPASLRSDLLDAGRKTSAYLVTDVSTTTASHRPKQSGVKKRIIGIMWRGGDKYAWYEGEDPAALNATRWTKYG